MAQTLQADRLSCGSLIAMRTLVLDPRTAGLSELMERRKRSGLDQLDEIWEGVYHMVPAPNYAHGDIDSQLHTIIRPLGAQAGLTMTTICNIGEGMHDFRVPDGTLHRPGAHGDWHHSAALVIEVVSPRDESYEKFSFYAAHEIDEVLIVDPQQRSVTWFARTGGDYERIERSRLIDLGPDELAKRLQWPQVDQS
jgi:Uma2 family endonuclease